MLHISLTDQVPSTLLVHIPPRSGLYGGMLVRVRRKFDKQATDRIGLRFAP